jgi:hypothetical protein
MKPSLGEVLQALSLVGIEYEDGSWTCSAEPEPVVLDSLDEAVRCFARLKDQPVIAVKQKLEWCLEHYPERGVGLSTDEARALVEHLR